MSTPDFTDARIHSSCAPEALLKQLDHGFQQRDIPPRFHYESARQARAWMDLHTTHSPAANRSDVIDIYQQAHQAAAQEIGNSKIQLVALGPGGGDKEVDLINELGKDSLTSVTCIDSSLPLALTSTSRLSDTSHQTNPSVADFNHQPDIRQLADLQPDTPTLFTFYGMLPNLPSHQSLAWLSEQMAPGDTALISANLSPNEDLKTGAKEVLHQYANPETQRWLSILLRDHGIDPEQGEWIHEIAQTEPDHSRIEIHFQPNKPTTAQTITGDHHLKAGEKLRLLYSHRHCPKRLSQTLTKIGLKTIHSYIEPEGHEGVFLIRK